VTVGYEFNTVLIYNQEYDTIYGDARQTVSVVPKNISIAI